MSLAALLSPVCAVAEDDGADADAGWLLPEEAAALGARRRRAREFAVARTCARRALGALGVPPAPIKRGTDRQPLWPPGIAGSITHCRGYCAAAVAPTTAIRSLGIDAEPNQPVGLGVMAKIAFGRERDWLRAAPTGAIAWDRLLFSAKESVFKAWYPLAERWLGFEDAEVTIDAAAGAFTADLRVAGPVTRFTGRYAIAGEHVLTAVMVPAAAAAPQTAAVR